MADKVSIAKLNERLVALDQKAGAASQAAHTRIDRLEYLIQEDFKEIKGDIKGIVGKMDDVTAWMNRGKGWAAAALLVAGFIGAFLMKALTAMTK